MGGNEVKRSEVAVDKYLSGYNCAQAVLYAFSDDLNMDKEAALKISCGFGGGMGLKEEVCGAVSGGVMALGLIYGRGENQDRSLTQETYRKTREFMDVFAEKHGSFICRKLLGDIDLRTPEGQKAFKEKDLRNTVCKPCVADAVEIVERMIDKKTD